MRGGRCVVIAECVQDLTKSLDDSIAIECGRDLDAHFGRALRTLRASSMVEKTELLPDRPRLARYPEFVFVGKLDECFGLLSAVVSPTPHPMRSLA